MAKTMCAVTAIVTVLLCFNLQSSLASNAIDPKGNPVPENPTTLPSSSVGSSDSSGSPGNVPVSSETLGSILFPSSAPPAAGNDTHCENNVSDNDNITVPLIPAAPVPVSSTTTSASISTVSSTITTAAPLLVSSAATTTSASPVSSQPSSPAPVDNNLSSSPAPASGDVGVTEATQAASSTTAGNSFTLGVVSSTAATATTQNSREGKNIDIQVQANASSSSSVSTGELPRGYYLPPKNALK